MSKRKKPARTARGRINAPRTQSPHARVSPPPRAGGGRGLWLYGLHAVAEALKNPDRKRHRLIATAQALEALSAALGAEFHPDPHPETVDRGEVDAACGPDAVHQGVALFVEPLPDLDVEGVVENAPESDVIVVLDQATDPRNIGAVMRSARAFGANALVCQDRNAPPETGAMAKAASGALEHIPLVRVTNLARALWSLKDAGYWCLGLDGDGDTLIGAVDMPARCVIVLGAEGSGLRRLTRETCDQLVRIPIDPDAESLNLSNAAAVALYEVARRRAG